MADNQLFNDNDVGGDEDIFVYTGGEQRVPRDVKRVRIAENIDTILARTFSGCRQLTEVKGHNKLKKIEHYVFSGCIRLRRVRNMQGVIEIEEQAFIHCTALGDYGLSELEFDKLEIIGAYSFAFCESLRSINMPSIRRVGVHAFEGCAALMDAVFGQDLERIEGYALAGCDALRRIVIPLKHGLILEDNVFNRCDKLSKINVVVGGLHKTISSLHLESWKVEMKDEIDSINQTLPSIRDNERTQAIQRWIARVLGRLEHYKSEHKMLLKEAMTLFELALWKAKLLNKTDEKKCNMSKKANIDTETARKENRVTCGASIVIKNVLPFLALA